MCRLGRLNSTRNGQSAGEEPAAALVEELKGRSEGHALAFSDLRAVRVAVDQKLAALDAPLEGAREVAFFPPVTGG